MNAPRPLLSRLVFGLRITAYACGVAGMVMMMVARSMEQPGQAVWGKRAMVLLVLTFIGFMGCYVLAFAARMSNRRPGA